MKNRSFSGLYMNFDELRDQGIFPLDLDFVYQCRDGYIIFGEIKNEHGEIKGMQKRVLEDLADGKGILLDLAHSKYVQRGDTEVAISDCWVRAEYENGRWTTYREGENALERIQELVNAHRYK